MPKMIMLLKMVACLAGAIALGNWFLTRARRGHARGEPWYRAYLSAPGLIILAVLFGLPLLLWLIS